MALIINLFLSTTWVGYRGLCISHDAVPCERFKVLINTDQTMITLFFWGIRVRGKGIIPLI
jgi:hypothetical protein